MKPREIAKLTPDSTRSVLVVNSHAPRYGFMWHYHEHFELFLMHKGSGQWLIGDRSGAYAPGDVFLIGPRLPHAFYTVPGSDRAQQQHQLIMFHFPPTEVMPELREIQDLLTRAGHGIRLKGRRAREVQQMLSPLRPSRPADEGSLEALLLLLAALRKLGSEARPRIICPAYAAMGTLAQSAGRINAVCRYLHDRFTQSVSLAEVAEHAHTSISHLCAAFHRATGRSVLQYIHELRINHACNLLRTTDVSVTEVAAASGFASLSSFHRQFRKQRRTTPRSLRRGGSR